MYSHCALWYLPSPSPALMAKHMLRFGVVQKDLSEVLSSLLNLEASIERCRGLGLSTPRYGTLGTFATLSISVLLSESSKYQNKETPVP